MQIVTKEKSNGMNLSQTKFCRCSVLLSMQMRSTQRLFVKIYIDVNVNTQLALSYKVNTPKTELF